MAKKASSSKKKMTYYFGKTRCDGRGKSKQLLGGKGTNLAEMTAIGLPVPPGFTITTECCDAYYKGGTAISENWVISRLIQMASCVIAEIAAA